MENLVRKIKLDHPGLVFKAGQAHCWSPERGHISYTKGSVEGLLHELGHARLGHEQYLSDIELLQKEVEAWHEAECLAELYGITLDHEHIEDCLDTYRDWLHKRSTCPTCLATGLQETAQRYLCLNCDQTWRVTASRFGRPYRRAKQPAYT